MSRFDRILKVALAALLAACWSILLFPALRAWPARASDVVGSFQWLLLAIVVVATPRAPLKLRLLLAALSCVCGLVGVIW